MLLALHSQTPKGPESQNLFIHTPTHAFHPSFQDTCSASVHLEPAPPLRGVSFCRVSDSLVPFPRSTKLSFA